MTKHKIKVGLGHEDLASYYFVHKHLVMCVLFLKVVRILPINNFSIKTKDFLFHSLRRERFRNITMSCACVNVGTKLHARSPESVSTSACTRSVRLLDGGFNAHNFHELYGAMANKNS